MELSLQPKVDVQQGIVQFTGYEVMLGQAEELAELIRSVDVNDESIKTTKKLLAEVNRRVEQLEQERIRIKKELLVPYMEFEKKIKEITSVVKESDNELRSKVRELEEIERQGKARILTGMFGKRIEAYPDLFFLTADRFITPQHLNKTVSLNKCEQDMVVWLEQRQREVELIGRTAGASLERYAESLDIVDALPKQEPVSDTPVTMDTLVSITINEADLSKVHLFLKMSGIPYAIKKD